jgi:hypothetical protein
MHWSLTHDADGWRVASGTLLAGVVSTPAQWFRLGITECLKLRSKRRDRALKAHARRAERRARLRAKGLSGLPAGAAESLREANDV